MPRSSLSLVLRDLSIDLNAFLFPPSCVVCRSRIPPRWPLSLCSECRRRLVPIAGPTCLLCRSELRDSAGFIAGRTCRDPGHAPFRVYAAVQMIDPADRLVHALKFHDRPEVGATLAAFITRRLRSEGMARWDRVLPMPLHRTRLRARGYNQSAEIAAQLARSLDAVFTPDLLLRSRATRAQADLDHAAREANVRGAFVLGRTRPGSRRGSPRPGTGDPNRRRDSLEDCRCLVVDDVATTGHTLLQALTALHAAKPETSAAAVFALA